MRSGAQASVPVTAPEREMTLRLHRERFLALAWGAPLLLQVAEPRVAQAVADHSVFLNDPARRLERLYATADLMLWLLLGTPDEVRRAADWINRVHDRVQGRLAEDHAGVGLPVGTAYSAHTPELLAWVHVAVHAVMLEAYQALVGPLSRAEQDRYCREVAAVGPLLGIPDHLLPREAATLRACFAAGLPRLSVSGPARRIARGVLHPPHPWWGSPLVALARLWTVGFLPPPVRAAYGLSWGPGRQVAFRLSLWLMRRVLLPLLPGRLRYVPPEIIIRSPTPQAVVGAGPTASR